ncbi:hypothetical protein Pmar_PMAR018774 [Perkinsus marinus ATCC 50983]|uniref:Uncharacterized protein n=1 Tax=Perkinsus marinus (strain ATCC 50983 / TXsc) TaxID=423536 RepID=C5KJC1_PERM5|nr:hypothetical protein Pmar_PMAR018774 [Perkinsus marinus ATCC 50983]EER15423.1 hypothetical protein Pmar_PMAR018774 [Perkinsus marinus ATCC 50983]|eukprot:XP_002783627.1 hypothetical protein Pmar_PMAR018774 [Perkinsus marinus ATCC 50983]
MDYLLARLLELEAIPLRGVRAFVSNWASAMVSNDAEVEGRGSPAAAQAPLDFARAILSMVLHAGLVHGMPIRPLLWLASALAVISTKRKYRLVRSIELGNDRDYFDALFEALIADTAMGGTGSATNRSPSIAGAVSPTGDGEPSSTASHSRRQAPLNVFRLPLEYTEFEGPTSATPYSAFKGGVQTSIKFHGIDNERDCMLFLLRHIGKSLRSELITHLGTAQPAPSAVWGYLDSRFLETDTSEKASERWESLKQNTGEKVDEYYARIKSEWLLFSRDTSLTHCVWRHLTLAICLCQVRWGTAP